MNLVRGYPRAAFIGLLTAGLISTAVTVAVPPAHADEPTVSQDTYRDGWDQSETALDPASVTSPDFGQQFSTALDGEVYAQPLVVGNNLIAVTENDKVYGLDRATGAIQWTDNFGPFWPAGTIGCSDLTPNVGITAAPVYDPASGYVYLVAKVNDGTDALHPHYYMHAVSPTTGTEKPGFPVSIGGHPSNDASATFDPAYQGQRPGLLLLGGVVYAAFGSHCDYGTDWRGYVAGVSTAGVQTALWSDETGAGIVGGGIWAGGGGLVSDGPGQILLSTGNGNSGAAPAPGPGNKPPGDLSESVVRLHVNTNGSLSPTDFFSPSNATTMDANDTDLGAGGPMALPDGFGTAAHPNLLVQMGKDGRLFLLDRGNLGGHDQGAGGTDNVLGMLGPYQGQWGHPAFWGGDGGYVYLVGNGGPLRAFKYGVSGTGMPALTAVGTSAATFNYTSGSPVVTSNGTTRGSAVVWVVSSSGPTGTNSMLDAYAAEPDASGNLALLWSAPIGDAVKFATAATSGNRVYIGTRNSTGTPGATDGHIIAFGRPTTSALTGSPVNFGDVAVSTTGNGTLTVTASKQLTITNVSASSPFGVSMPSTTSLAPGASVGIPATFTPGAAGTITGSITVTTDSGVVSFGVSGRGTAPGLAANPPNLTFTDQPTGLSTTQNIQVTNTGTSTETVSSASAPGAPYAITGLPAAGATVAAGGSFIVSVTYDPTVTGTNTGSISINSSSNSVTHALSIPLTGNAVVGQGNMTITPQPVDFGAVALGSTTTHTFTLTNAGNIPVTVTKAKAPISDFSTTTPLPEGQQLAPGQSWVQSINLTPTKLGTDTDSYEVTADDGQGAHFIQLTANVLSTLPAVPTSWQVNGSATLPANSPGTIQLTAAQSYQGGSAFSTLPVPTNGLVASFTAQLYGGTGADGMAFALIDSSKNGPTVVGNGGGGLGLDGLPGGIGVALDTYQNAQANSNNFVGIVTSADSNGGVTWLTTAPVPAPLRTGSHNVSVSINNGAITVFVDGQKLIDSYTPAAGLIPASAYAGFTAGTGMGNDIHAAGNIVIATAAPSAATPPTATPASVTFQAAPVGFKELQNIQVNAALNAPVLVTGVTAPTGAFSAPFVPAIGQVLPAGASFPVHVGFTPATAGPVNGSIVINTTGGTLTIPINASTSPPTGTFKPVS